MRSGISVRHFDVGEDVGPLPDLMHELDVAWDVLLGRVDPPVRAGVGTLMEVAEAYHARALEINAHIQRQERMGSVLKNSPYYRFRTGELRSFIDASRRSIELGSRRITLAQMGTYNDPYTNGMMFAEPDDDA